MNMNTLSNSLTLKLMDLIDDIKYDVFKLPLPPFSEIPIPNKLHLKFHYEKDGIWVEADEYSDFYAVASSLESLPLAIHEAILLYCGVPRYFSRRQPKTGFITLPDGKTINLVDSIDKELNYRT